jgi:type IV pilus assembly protein PilA
MTPASPRQSRLNRVQFAGYLALLFFVLLLATLAAPDNSQGCAPAADGRLIWLVSVAALVVLVWLAARRLHDFNASGWWAYGFMVLAAPSIVMTLVERIPGLDLPAALAGPVRIAAGYGVLACLPCALLLCLIPGNRAVNRYGEPRPRRVRDYLGLVAAVLLLGIAAIGIPSYADYTGRARVAEGLSLAAAAKTGVAEFFAQSGELPASNDDAGLPKAQEMTGNSVRSVAVAPGGVITVTFAGGTGRALRGCEGKTIVLTPEIGATGGRLTWDCRGGTLPRHLRPGSCRP